MSQFSADNKSNKLFKDENQLLALNYENLCDSDYLNRLFTSQSNDQFDNQYDQNKEIDNESWLLTGDIAEDIIVFGSDLTLGKHLMQKRFLKSIAKFSGDNIRKYFTIAVFFVNLAISFIVTINAVFTIVTHSIINITTTMFIIILHSWCFVSHYRK